MSHGVRTPPLAASRSARAANGPMAPPPFPRGSAGRGTWIAGHLGLDVDGRADGVAGRAGERGRTDGRGRDDEPEGPVGRLFGRRRGRDDGIGLCGSAGSAASCPSTSGVAAAAATTGTVVAGRGPSSSAPAIADSYSATDAKTANPADAASARVAGSPDTIDSRFSWVSASRGEQPEIDARRRDPRAVRQDDRDPRRLGGADARRRGGDLVVDLEVDDPAGHGQTFIARRTRRSATSSASSDVCSSMAW